MHLDGAGFADLPRPARTPAQQRMESEPELTGRLRDRIVSATHVGRVHEGDRLPGVREVARETGANPRTVAKAYRVLEAEGLVEIRGRSGVYVARQDHWGGKLPAETGRWLGGILLEAWKRHIPIPDLAELIRHCTVGVHLRALCVDGTVDELRSICAELETAFGIACTALPASDLPRKPESVPQGDPLRAVDMLVTTTMFAAQIRPLADAWGKPLVVVTLHPDIVSGIDGRLAEGGVTVVCVDPAFGDQVRAVLRGTNPERIQVVLADDARAIAELDARTPVLLTLAARERLGETELTPLLPLDRFISPESARQLSELMIRLHMEAEHTSE